MSGSGRAGNGRGNNRRRPFRRRNRDNNNWQERGVSDKSGGTERNLSSERSVNPEKNEAFAVVQGKKLQGRSDYAKRGSENTRGERPSFLERPKWVPPKVNTDPLPVPDCPWCGKPIREISLAMADKDTGVPVHFECVTSRIARGENLEKGDAVIYIGGGRFGIVSFGNEDAPRVSPASPAGSSADSQDRDFKIKKIIEWENKEKKADWRSAICEHYSIT